MQRLIGALSAIALFLVSSGLANGQEPKAVVEKAIKAAGGADKLGKLKAFTAKFKGKFDHKGESSDFTMNVSMQGTDQIKVELEVEDMGMRHKMTFAVAGDT